MSELKTISIGDIHGSKHWKRVEVDLYDKVIFLGDYVDDWPPRTDKQIFDNLLEIIELKEKNRLKVELLLGNHDLQYMFRGNSQHGCSGLRQSMLPSLGALFNDNKHLFKAAHQELDKYGKIYLWTHAGVTERWYIQRLMPFIEEFELKNKTIATQLNIAFNNYKSFMFDVGFMRGGMNSAGGPFWADQQETWDDMLSNINQIVGHSKVPKIKTLNEMSRGASVTYIDRLHSEPEFYELNL